jgi:hypothetical protein
MESSNHAPTANCQAQSDPMPRKVSEMDPARHLNYKPPTEVITLRDLLLSEANSCSSIAITAPFPLFSLEGVTEIRKDIFRAVVVRKHAQVIRPGVNKMRGYAQDTPFVNEVWRYPDVVNACPQAAGVELQLQFDYEIGHVNVQLDGLIGQTEVDAILPPAIAPKSIVGVEMEKLKEETKQTPVRDWHVDSYPWVCVCMLFEPEGMVGGETGLECGDGSMIKTKGSGVGWTVMMQGGCTNHIALEAYGCAERITMVTSFRPRPPLANDMSTLNITNKSSRLEELFPQWVSYRKEVLAARAHAIRDEIMRDDSISVSDMKIKVNEWVEKQKRYLETTYQEMHDAVPLGVSTEVH